MKKLVTLLLLIPIVAFGNDQKIPTNIKEVTVYLSGAQITRTAQLQLAIGANEISFTGLSPKIDESSIQISGLKSVSILSVAFDLDYLEPSKDNPEVALLELRIIATNHTVAKLQNKIAGLVEEQKVINANRLVSGENLTLDLERIKEISTYYRQRMTAIKNEIFDTNIEINKLKLEVGFLQKQMTEINSSPIKEHGVVRLKLDAPVATSLTLQISYTIQDAGWIPNYDIKSWQINDPLRLTYKAHVYQRSGIDWENVKINLSSGSPSLNVAKPNLTTKYLDFVSRHAKRSDGPVQKQKYFHNPTVKKVVGQVTDESGLPLPGVNISVIGTSNATTTDFDGNYSLDVLNGQGLTYSYIGFKSVEIPVYSSIMNLQLQEDAQHLDEVVVVAYGSSSNTLQGKAAGIRIRGAASNPSDEKSPEVKLPLYIIDGVPVADFMDGDLDEDEIQSIEVLKGSNAEALYGVRATNGVVLISTKKSYLKEGITDTRFEIKKPYSILSDGDITAIELNSFDLQADYEHFAAPILNENVFMTATFKDWEQHNLLPGEANVYFEGAFAGKTSIDPYTTKKEMTLSLGIDPNITVVRKQDKNFKSKSFTGSNRILDRTYELVVKNNKSVPINIKLMDRVPLSQNKEIKVDDIETFNADYDSKKGLLVWKLEVAPKASKTEVFSFKVRYPKFRTISL